MPPFRWKGDILLSNKMLDKNGNHMSLSDYITIIATVITIVGMVVTIVFANMAKTYKEQIQFDIRKINLTNVVEKLKRTQDEIRMLPKSKPIKRGVQINEIISNIKSHFDYALNTLDSDGPDSAIRDFVSDAQNLLNMYELDFSNDELNSDAVVNITECLQNAISKSNTKILKLEKDL